MTRNVLRSICVDASAERAFGIWSDFERFPRFMSHIRSIEVEGRRLYWSAMLDGRPSEWTAEIVELSPYRRIAWHALNGRHHNVVVTRRPLDDAQTEVTFGAEHIASRHEHELKALRFEQCLQAFKELVESPRLTVVEPEIPLRFLDIT